MRTEITTIDTIDKSMLVFFHGMWNTNDTVAVADAIQEQQPQYLVVDPTECILTGDIASPIDEAPNQRQTLVNRIATLMQKNPQMLYIIINRNDNEFLKTSIPLYQSLGIEDRYLFVNSLEQAIAVIKKHQYHS